MRQRLLGAPASPVPPLLLHAPLHPGLTPAGLRVGVRCPVGEPAPARSARSWSSGGCRPRATHGPRACSPEDEFFSGDNGVDLLIEDQLLRHTDLLTSVTRHGAAVTTDVGTEITTLPSAWPEAPPSVPGVPTPPVSASVEPPSSSSTPLPTPSVFPEPPGEADLTPAPQAPATTVAYTAAPPPPTSAPPPAAPGDTPGDAFLETAHSAPVPPTTGSLGKDATAGQGTAPASPTLSPEEEDGIRNVIGEHTGPGLASGSAQGAG